MFQTEFAIPIAVGGYTNATEVQLHTAYQCARKLRDLIARYLLRRMKKDVGSELPQKKEQVTELVQRLSEASEGAFLQTDILPAPRVSKGARCVDVF